MRILQIVPSRTWGGGERYIYDLCEGLLKSGCDIEIVTRPSQIVERRFDKLAKVIALPLRGMFDLKSINRIAQMVDCEGVDVIHAHIFKDAFIAVLASRLSKRRPKVLMTRHLVKRGKDNLLYRWLYRRLETIIFVSKLACEEFLSGLKRPIANVQVIHNSIAELPMVEEVDFEGLYGIPGDDLVVGFNGRLSLEKGVDDLIDAFSRLKTKNAKLVIVGSGDEQYCEYLNGVAEQKGVEERVIFTGFVDNVASIANRFTVAVAPSRWREPFGLVLLEYMALGIPIITTNNGAQTEILTSQVDGILIDPSNPQMLADAIDNLLSNLQLRQDLVAQASKTFLKFDYQKYIDKVIAIYKK